MGTLTQLRGGCRLPADGEQGAERSDAVAAKRTPRQVAAPGAPPAPRKGAGLGRLRFRVTLALLLALMVAGLASTEGAVLLQRALRTPTADDIAQRVCTAYLTQDYGLLVSQIDPATILPNVTTPWDAQAQAALVGQLHIEDAALGQVTHCTYLELAASKGQQPANTRQYLFSMQRAKLYSTGMDFNRQGDASWLIARDSDFLGVPAGSQ